VVAMKNLKGAIISSGLMKIMGMKGMLPLETMEKDLQSEKVPYDL